MPSVLAASDRSGLIRLAATMPKGSLARRTLLWKLAEAPVEEESSSGGGKGPGKLLLKFLDEVGDQKVKNPDTGNQVKVKTLSGKPKDTQGYKLFLSEFEKWKEQLAEFEKWKEQIDENWGLDKDEKGKPKPGKPKPEKPKPGKPKPEKPKPKKKAPPEKPKKKAPPEADWAGTTDAERHEWGAQQNPVRERWPDSQREALLTYTGEAYTDINNSLRANGDGGYHSDAVREMDALFDSPEGKLDRPVKVSRGVGSGHPLVKMIQNGELEPGDYFEDKGYQSTSIKSDLSWGDYKLHITVPKGARAAYVGPKPDDYSEFASEQELLLDRGTKIEITKYDESTGVIHARVVTD